MNLVEALRILPSNASEADVDCIFSSVLLQALGFQAEEIVKEYDTGGGGIADFAARNNCGEDIFLHSRLHPYLILELKGKEISLTANTSSYTKTFQQLKRHLLGSHCRATQWGIITNSSHIQLFRKHGKVIFPATQCLEITEQNIVEVVERIRQIVQNPKRALTVTVYNNKGGIGKTTTTVNLSAILAYQGKKVLAVDFDQNQQDLTGCLGITLHDGAILDALTTKDSNLKTTIRPYVFQHRNLKRSLGFDVVPADKQLKQAIDADGTLRGKVSIDPPNILYKKLEFARSEYDYIFIDAPPNWLIFSKLAMYAADVVLIPTKHNDRRSLINARVAIQDFAPEIQAKKKDGTPIVLPIFFNGETITSSQLQIAQNEILAMIKEAKKEGFDLVPYFYPKYTHSKKDLHIHHLPNYAKIASAAFAKVPAVYCSRFAHDYYKELAKEYFLL